VGIVQVSVELWPNEVCDTEEEHNEIVEELLRRLEENDLYVKPEKCTWKM